ncbi:hypothetical protein PBY51_016267 [Eleginops maclovinus]|uniref:Uncharacterized protein n=1 Tax=Eleginops maclovinus TaxID=56733 RepID=A0AAN7XSJ0_ELEMC|nr:hypothetical protein PBY51_016267 [Eleginops maclovinus]
MISTTNDAASDWCLVFHHRANELRLSLCGGVISPTQLEDSDRDEKRRRNTAERGEEMEIGMRDEEPRGKKR